MKFTHDEMMLIIQGLRIVAGYDENYADETEALAARGLLYRIDEDATNE